MANSDLTNSVSACGSWAPPEVIRDLHENQSGDGRHKCVVCAYQRGYDQAKADAACPVPDHLQSLIELLTMHSDPYPEDHALIVWLRRGLK